ncbi:PEP/pyruvate-binding domain-containing protein [Nocardia carnea]|uniref:PEP/pyruvate-binding domain-containing protein n=1 Tax=Nocardia carnea TaxID=37328 RepID=UPI00245510F7|nr:PEP/pyruvate-binding domain-containing protein [Nocardia carnea]
MRVLSADDTEADIAAFGGSKARGLYALGAAGAQVPEWLVLGADVFAEFAAAAGSSDLIGELSRADEVDTALELAERIRGGITAAGATADSGLRELLRATHIRLGRGALVVRSSPVGFHDDTDSFAGLFDTYVNVGSDELYERVRDCWVSGFSESVVRYTFARNQSPVTGIAVLLQQFIAARASGVLFTRNPAAGSADDVVVSAVHGLGVGLTAGAIDADTVLVDRAGTVVERITGGKEVEYVAAAGSGVEVVEPAQPRRAGAVLDDDDVALLAGRGRALAGALGGPRDIEWAIDSDGLWFLQARPITTLQDSPGRADRPRPAAGMLPIGYRVRGNRRAEPLVHRRDTTDAAVLRGAGEPVAPGEPRIWAAANEFEILPGPVSPLTFTMAADLYGRVYRGYAQSLGVPKEQIRQIDSWSPYLLGIFHGRVYVNLLHWYRTAGIAPGYSLARPAVATVIGVGEPLPDEHAKTLQPFVFDNGWRRAWSRVRTAVVYLRRILAIDAMMREFHDEFSRLYDRYDTMEYIHGEHAYAEYRRLDRDLVLWWGPTTVLDAIQLTLTGTVLLLTKAFLPGAPESLVDSRAEPGSDPDDYLDAHLGGIRRSLYDRVRAGSARCAAHREQLQFYRTRAFGSIERMIRVMGRDLVARGIIDDAADIFLLTVDELRNCYDRVPVPDLAARITARKVARTADADMVAPVRFTTLGPELTDVELAQRGWVPLAETPPAAPGDVLAGFPSAPGVVEGVAELVDEPRDVAGGILVVRRADPGWAAALPSSAALVAELGDPLTPVATIARELGVPAVLRVPGCRRKLRTGMRIRVDGAAGTVTVLSGGGHGDGAG